MATKLISEGEYGDFPLGKFIGGKKRQQNSMQFPSLVDKVPPHSADAEMAVLGAIMLDKAAFPKVIEILPDPDNFYKEAHRKIYEVMQAMFSRNITIDLISLSEELRRFGSLEAIGGSYYISEINTRTPTAANVEHYARIVQEHYLKRQLILIASQILADSYDESTDALEEIDAAESKIFEIAEKRLRRSYVSMNQLARETFEMIVSLSEKGGHSGVIGVPTGYPKLDEKLGGLQKSDLIIIAARPSMGKTSLAMSIARNAAVESRIPVAIFSIEMAAVQLAIRLLSAEIRVNAHSIRTGHITEDVLPRLAQNIGILAEAPMYIDDSPSLTVLELRAKCRRLKSEHNIGLVVIDYLQLMQAPKSESREREISTISRSLKQLAKELDLPVIALSQLNRSVESRGDKRPMLSDLRESGSIEQDADVVMFINRPEHYEITTYEDGTPTEGTAEIIIGKQRNGPVGTVRLAFLKDFARFENLAFGAEEPPDYSGSNFDFEAPAF